MGEITKTTCSGVRCDRRSCTEEIRGEEKPSFEGVRFYERLAVERGWTFWAGRGRRMYCPSHGPTKGHKMWLVAGSPSGGDTNG